MTRHQNFLLGSVLTLALAGPAAHAEAPAAAPTKEATTPKRPADGNKKGSTAAHDEHAGGHDNHGGMGMGGMGKHEGMMMGGGMADGCPMMMAGGDTTMTVNNLPNGVTITLTAQNAETVTRLQKMAEKMHTKHEAHGK